MEPQIYNYVGWKLIKDSEDKVLSHLYNNLKGNMEMTTEKTLYEIKQFDKTHYGYKLATNGQGQWIMEIKGSGEVIAVDKKEVSEVIPYTVGIKFHSSSQIYHYLDEKRSVKKGDVLVVDSLVRAALDMVYVSDVDTKSKTATKEISFLKNLGSG